MALYAQNATITFGSDTISEVSAYRVASLPSALKVGEFGTVEVQSYTQLPSSALRRYRVLTISHGTTQVFRGTCLVQGVRVDASVNDVVRYTTTFAVLWIPR